VLNLKISHMTFLTHRQRQLCEKIVTARIAMQSNMLQAATHLRSLKHSEDM